MSTVARRAFWIAAMILCACTEEPAAGGGDQRIGDIFGDGQDPVPDAGSEPAVDGGRGDDEDAGSQGKPGVAGAGGSMEGPDDPIIPEGCTERPGDEECPFACPEICNDVDDDCDDRLDEEEAQDECAAQHADMACQDGTCLIAMCLDDHRDCDDAASTGCEAPPDDVRNCGGCGKVCVTPNAAAECTDNSCGVGACYADFADCDDDPLDCETSLLGIKNCRGCGTLCADVPHALPSCNTGVCGPGLCVGNYGDCNAQPADGCEEELITLTDCGGCGQDCTLAGSFSDCGTGVCVALGCDAGNDECDGNPANGCESLSSNEHCGACGSSCDPDVLPNVEESTCNAMNCEVATCKPGFGNCDPDDGNGCENTLDSNLHCGACDTPCEIDHAIADCSTGTCQFVMCEDGWGDCANGLADGCEQSLDTLTHCGGCNVPCAMASCGGGTCTSISCTAPNADCDMDGATCEADLEADDLHCGACNAACNGPLVVNGTGACMDSSCEMTCNADFGNCDGDASDGCEQPLNTLTHCSACNTGCNPPTGTPDCSTGMCEVTSCPMDRDDCDMDGNTGCETLLNSTMNCGACFMQCDLPNAVESCGGVPGARVCEIAVCDTADFDNCDVDHSTGCETDKRIATEHCGACGNDCEMLQQVFTAHCAASACAIDTCNAGYGNCDPDILNGCEQPLDVPSFCGSCFNDCDTAMPNTDSTLCVGGAICEVDACTDGYADCDAPDNLNGCETDTHTTADCGGCSGRGENDPCEGLPNVMASSCGAGDCVIDMCDAGWLDCDMDTTTGCEQNLAMEGICCTFGTDSDMDGTDDCVDECDNDPNKVVPGDCGCADAPASMGTSCDDGVCALSTQCDGAGQCGSIVDCVVTEGTWVTTDYWHGCGIQGGQAHCWGNNQWGKLGDGTFDPHNTPEAVTGLADAIQVSARGGDTTGTACAVRAGGTVECWGYGAQGNVGNMASNANNETPVQVSNLSDAVQVSVSWTHACAVRNGGGVVCWGNNGTAQLGDGSVTPSNEPVDVSNIADAIQVSAGHFHSCAVRAGGEVMCWGWRANGRIGDGNTINNAMTPTPVTGITDALQVSAGDSHTCAVHQDGDVSCWGSNVSGQLGDGTQFQRVLPVSVPAINAVQVSAGYRHTCAVLSDGTAACWGSQNNGRLGNDETFDNALSPDPVHLLTGVVQIAAGYWGSCAANTLGAIYCWGEGQQGLLGTGSSIDQAEPSGPLVFP